MIDETATSYIALARGYLVIVPGPDGQLQPSAQVALNLNGHEQDADWIVRVIECVNACVGIPSGEVVERVTKAFAERDALLDKLSDSELLKGRLALELLKTWSGKIPPDITLKLKELTAQRDLLLGIIEPAIASGAITQTTEADIAAALVSRSEDARKQIMREEKLRTVTGALLDILNGRD